MTENESHGKAGKKQMGEAFLSLWHASSAYIFDNNLMHEDGEGVDPLIQITILDKNVDWAIFGNDLIKIKKENRFFRSRTLLKEEIYFNC